MTVFRAEFHDPDGVEIVFLVAETMPPDESTFLEFMITPTDGVPASIRLNGWGVGLLMDALRRYQQQQLEG